MKLEQEYTPKYWVVHDKQASDVFPATMRKSKWESEATFLNYHSFDIVGVLSDNDLETWFLDQDRYVCELIEIRLV